MNVEYSLLNKEKLWTRASTGLTGLLRILILQTEAVIPEILAVSAGLGLTGCNLFSPFW